MAGPLVSILRARDAATRDRPLDDVCAGVSPDRLLDWCAELDDFARGAANLYEQVRALFFLQAIHRFHLAPRLPEAGAAPPLAARRALLARRFAEAAHVLVHDAARRGPSAPRSVALAEAYRGWGFARLGEQVRHSVRGQPENAWLFEARDPATHPHPLDARLRDGTRAVLERTPVRMDLSHSGWSDIFFLAMDRPEGARVLNVSIDLAVRLRGEAPAPPVEARVRALDAPRLRLHASDLDATVELERIEQVFDFAADSLGLLRAGVVAAGLVPPALEEVEGPLAPLLERLVGPGRGLEVVTRVRGIPRGSRLAVSTTLLACLTAAAMRASGQTRSLEGPLGEDERRVVVSRAILGEWLGGSGGGWQDSGGLWPGAKRIEGVAAAEGDPEWGHSRGRLLPRHVPLGDAFGDALRADLQRSLVLVHGGMAQDVGPVLEQVTESYLLRSEPAWTARREAEALYDELLAALEAGDVRRIARATDRNFHGPLATIVPQATNAYTERVIAAASAELGPDYWGFWMLGGMSGGGMGFWVDPVRRGRATVRLQRILEREQAAFASALPFAMAPVIYDVEIDDVGSVAGLVDARGAPAPAPMPRLPAEGRVPRMPAGLGFAVRFDAQRHERLREALRAGEMGLAHNRLPAATRIEDVRPGDLAHPLDPDGAGRHEDAGRRALGDGRCAVVTLAGGLGSRWSHGAGVVKALAPVCRLAGRQRSFLEIHRAKARATGRHHGRRPLHVVTTSYATHGPIERAGTGDTWTSEGRDVGLRLVPTVRDLEAAFEARRQRRLEPRAERLRGGAEAAALAWVRARGEASDYGDNAALECLHPLGHGVEIPNLLRSGTLRRLLEAEPGLDVLLVHNVDALGADLDPALLGWFLDSGADLAFELVPRFHDDAGGGLARVDGRLELVEGLALPDPELESGLSTYNFLTTWVSVDGLLRGFGLVRGDLADAGRVEEAADAFLERLPATVRLKEVKRRWGHGQEDIHTVAQLEWLWGDVTRLPDFRCRYALVPRRRGQPLEHPGQLDAWRRDGSLDAVAALCDWDEGGA